MESFENVMNNQLKLLSESNDIAFLKAELEKTKKELPYCAAESLFRTNKLSVIENRIKVLCPTTSSCPSTSTCPFLKLFQK